MTELADGYTAGGGYNMFYEVAQVDGEWRVEAINFEGDGEIYFTLFPGLKGEVRAREYANLMNAASGGKCRN